MSRVKMCDPPSGWKYGFPKPIPSDLRSEDFDAWLVEEGYPANEVAYWELSDTGIPCRFWEAEIDE